MLDTCILFFIGVWVGGMVVGLLVWWYIPRREIKVSYEVQASALLEYGKLQTTEEMTAFRKRYEDNDLFSPMFDIVDEIKYPLEITDALEEK